MKYLRSILFICISFFVLIAFSGEAADLSITLVRASKKWLSFQGSSKNGGSATDERYIVTIEPDAKGYRLQYGKNAFQLKIKDKSYKLYTPDGKLLFKVKRKEGKIKILRSEEDPSPWSLKPKEDKDSFKIKKGDKEIGKCTWHAEKKVIRVKNTGGIVLCTATSPVPAMSPAVVLFEGLSDRDRLLLFALLAMIDAGV
jgi:hypothetical protein